MGFARERVGADGRVRYTAVYRDLKGRLRSAGTFSQRREADRAWQRAEAKVAQGYLGDPGRGRQTFRAYVENTWLPNHQVEASTLQGYTYLLNKHIMDEFGPMRMIDILPEHVREWITGLKHGGVKPPTIQVLLHRAQRHLHHGPQRPGDLAAPVQGREDPAGPGPAAHHHHARSSSRSCTTACLMRSPSCWWRPPWRAACAGVS